MKIFKVICNGNAWSNIQSGLALLIMMLIFSACSTINIEAARSLSETGRSIAVKTQENIFLSDIEYLRARDSEAIFHGFNGTVKNKDYDEILKQYDAIHQELAKRSVVLERIADAYDAFGDLSSMDASNQTETALAGLKAAIDEYAKLIGEVIPIGSNVIGIISKISGLTAVEIQKAKIKEASIQIRNRVKYFKTILSSDIVKKQMNGFKKFMSKNNETAFMIFFDKNVFDLTPILDYIGDYAGIAAQKDAHKIVESNKELKDAITEVISKRLEYKIDLIDQSYEVSLKSLDRLIAEHKKLEQGEELDLTRLREIVAQLRELTVLFAKTKTTDSKNH